jgi:hypothetical protein
VQGIRPDDFQHADIAERVRRTAIYSPPVDCFRLRISDRTA